MFSIFSIPTNYSLAQLSGLEIFLSLTPSNIERTEGPHKIGFVSLVNKNGISVSSGKSVEIELTSSNPQIASVPQKVTISGDSRYAQFDVITGGDMGQAVITAKLGDSSSSKKLTVGFVNENMDSNLSLEMAIPTSNMHINSKMPFSVFLKDSQGNLQRATKDIKIDLQYDENLVMPDSKSITIKEGQYYAWATLSTSEVTGNGYLHATQSELDLDTVKNIVVSSTRPASIKVEVFPKLVNADVERQIDIFVSLYDSTGNPTIAPDDIQLTLFTNNDDSMADDIDEINQKQKPVIKKGQFGYHLSHKFSLVSTLANFIEIGANAKGYGLAKDTFSTVKTTYTPDSERFDVTKPKITNSVDQNNPENVGVGYDFEILMYGPKSMPPGTESIVGFQTGVLEDDADDEDTIPCTIDEQYDSGEKDKDGNPIYKTRQIPSTCPNPNFYEVETDPDSCLSDKSNTAIDQQDTSVESECNLPILDVDNLSDGDFYPIQSRLNYEKIGAINDNTSITTSNNQIIQPLDSGRLENAQSSGFTKIKSGQISGKSTISVAIRGIGSQSFPIDIINSLEQKTTKVFSPFEDTLVVNPDGLIDVFIVPLDISDRPKKQIEDSDYLLTPVNSVLSVKKDDFFSFAQIKSDPAMLDTSTEFILSQVGSKLTQLPEFKQQFTTNSTSTISITMSNPKLTSLQENNLGVIQLVDAVGTPIVVSKDMPIKIESSNKNIAEISYQAVIPAGKSYGFFGINTMEMQGTAILTASGKGLKTSTLNLVTSPSESKLAVSIDTMPDSLSLNEPTDIKLSVFDSNQNLVDRANVEIYSTDKIKIEPKNLITNSKGEATFQITASSNGQVSLSITATKDGYLDGSKQLVIDSGTSQGIGLSDFKYESWMLFLIIAIVVIVGIFVFLFFRKTKEVQDWEEDI